MKLDPKGIAPALEAYGEGVNVFQLEDAIRAYLDAIPAQAEAVEVKELEWEEYWSGGNEDIPAWRAKNPLGLHISFSFAGRLFNGRQIERHSEAPDEEVTRAKVEKQADYRQRILSALAPISVSACTVSPAPANGAVTEEMVEREIALAEIEWSYHEDNDRYPRDFWHARIVWRGFKTSWLSYGEQEQRNLPDVVKQQAETDLRSELRSALSALAPVQGWRPIETAPKDGTEILVCGPHRDGGFYRDVQMWPDNWTGKWPVAYMAYALGEPTGWQPLPAAPASVAEGGSK